MKKSTILGLMLICLFSICSKLFGQAISANELCKKLGRGVNIIGYDKELWKDYTKGRFKEEYFKMIKHEFNAMAVDPVAKKEMFLSVWKQLAPRLLYCQRTEVFLIMDLSPPGGIWG